jgi:lipopolysaccharide transport system permease protein
VKLNAKSELRLEAEATSFAVVHEPVSAALADAASDQIKLAASAVARSSRLSEIWREREVLYLLTWRDVKVRYKQTLLGAAWAILQPLATMLVFSFIFGRLAKVPSNGMPYPAFVYAGLILWTYFAGAVSASAASMVENPNLITRIYFPRIFIPGGPILAGLIDLGIGMLMLAAVLVYYRITPSWALLLALSVLVQIVIVAFSLGSMLAALNAKYRDVRYALPFLIQFLFFLTPVIYPTSLLPVKWRLLLALNPLTGIIETFRSLLFGGHLEGAIIVISWAVTAALLLISVSYFAAVERELADVI